MQVAKKIPFDDPFVLNACRAAYAISNLLILGIYLYIKSVIDKKKGMPCLRQPQRALAHVSALRDRKDTRLLTQNRSQT